MINPFRYVKVDDIFMCAGQRYQCIKRPPIERPMDVCKGCDMGNTAACAMFQCSRFDRADDTNVWFKLI